MLPEEKARLLIDEKLKASPYSNIPFGEMNAEQAKEHFEWYKTQIPLRIEWLKKLAASDGLMDVFDFTPESLIPIWEWYEKKIAYRQLSEEEMQAEQSTHPEWMWDSIPDKDLSIDTLYYCVLLAAYFAEVVIRNTKGKVYWGYFTKPKNRVGLNEPTLLGFKFNKDLNPRTIVRVCTKKSGKEHKSSRLKDAYDTWTKKNLDMA